MLVPRAPTHRPRRRAVPSEGVRRRAPVRRGPGRGLTSRTGLPVRVHRAAGSSGAAHVAGSTSRMSLPAPAAAMRACVEATDDIATHSTRPGKLDLLVIPARHERARVVWEPSERGHGKFVRVQVCTMDGRERLERLCRRCRLARDVQHVEESDGRVSGPRQQIPPFDTLQAERSHRLVVDRSELEVSRQVERGRAQLARRSCQRIGP
eukprot:scaffold32324_cov71-Phaeocystis_antarctica.AAC.7